MGEGDGVGSQRVTADGDHEVVRFEGDRHHAFRVVAFGEDCGGPAQTDFVPQIVDRMVSPFPEITFELPGRQSAMIVEVLPHVRLRPAVLSQGFRQDRAEDEEGRRVPGEVPMVKTSCQVFCLRTASARYGIIFSPVLPVAEAIRSEPV